MKFKTAIRLLLVSLLASASAVHAAGGPMNEDLSAIAPYAQKALDAGKQGDSAAFVKASQDALIQAQSKPFSAATQRMVRQLKSAVTLGKEGKVDEGMKAVEEAMTDMKKIGG
ncbi:small metal-binding protein SmbP [Methylomagnum ishizawai]|uniref:Small metal-binding protein n=1 Tax=Methylomagnum ishizawai TaxID=1760988 RepID=A0A1Y6D422_9GAMM|nr:small metal-binding protein SmbP [Methylomagnum ishizawai]BBL75722.1 hypothetical protein MishRS11D_28200 [Methylomagnum ishizawai]SMF95292.1 Small metal-binding protein [Methylomagnum ishizawai]